MNNKSKIPNSDRQNYDEMESFYSKLQEAVQSTSSQDLLLVMGDFNANVGKDS
jgi:hypothetical protein